MTRVRTTFVFLFLAAVAVAAAAQTAQKQKPAATSSGKHAVVTSGDLKWGPAPPSLPAGAPAMQPSPVVWILMGSRGSIRLRSVAMSTMLEQSPDR